MSEENDEELDAVSFLSTDIKTLDLRHVTQDNWHLPRIRKIFCIYRKATVKLRARNACCMVLVDDKIRRVDWLLAYE